MLTQTHPLHVLIAEDNYDLQVLFSRAFKKVSFDVSVARNGQEALDMLMQSQPDIMILDVNMPLISGLDVINFIRQCKQTEKLRVIMVTGNCMAQYTQEADLADLFLVKPVNPVELVTMAQRLIAS